MLCKRTDTVMSVSQSELDQLLGALRVLGLIDASVLKSRSLTILGPLAPLAMQESANASPPTGTTPSPTAETETDSGSRPEGSSSAVFFCSHCSAPTRPVEASGQRFYAVIRGLEVGVFEGWRVFSTLKTLTSLTGLILRATVRHLIQNPDNLDISIPGIRTQVFSTRNAAEERFAEALTSGEVVKMSV